MSRLGTRVCTPLPDGRCELCGDDAVQAIVLAVDADGTAAVRARAGEMKIATDLLEHVRIGDRVLVHQGFAIARVEE